MALPQDGQDANGLTKVTQIPAGKELMFIDPTTNEGGIITLEDLTKQILNGLTSQTFGLDSGTQTLPAAINYLYGKSLKSVIMSISGIQIKNSDPGFGYYSDSIKTNIPEGTTIVAVVLCGGFSAGVMVSSVNKNTFTLSCNNSGVLPTNRSARIWYI